MLPPEEYASDRPAVYCDYRSRRVAMGRILAQVDYAQRPAHRLWGYSTKSRARLKRAHEGPLRTPPRCRNRACRRGRTEWSFACRPWQPTHTGHRPRRRFRCGGLSYFFAAKLHLVHLDPGNPDPDHKAVMQL